MRFFISPSIKRNPPLHVAVVLFLISGAVFWAVSWFLYGAKYGLTYERMFTYFFTDPMYPERIPLSQVLEDMHVNFFIFIMFLLVLSSIFLHKSTGEKVKYTLIAGSFLSGISEFFSSLLIYFLSPLFIYLKIASFVTFQLLTGVMLFLSLKLYATKEKEAPPERTILYAVVFMFTSSVFIFVVVNFFLFLMKLGITPESVAKYYLGDPSAFMKPKSLEGILEVLVPHTAAMLLYLFTLIHFSFFTNLRRKVLWSVIAVSSAVLDNFSGLMIRYLGPELSYLKIASFLVLESSMVYLSAVVLVSLIRHRAKAIVLL